MATATTNRLVVGLLDAFVNKFIRENKLLLRFVETERQIALNVVRKMCRCTFSNNNS